MGDLIHVVEVVGQGDVKGSAHATDPRELGIESGHQIMVTHRLAMPTISDDQTAQKFADQFADDLRARLPREPVSDSLRQYIANIHNFGASLLPND